MQNVALSFRPLAARIGNRLAQTSYLARATRAIDEVEPAVTRPTARPICLAGEFDRVRGVDDLSTFEMQAERLDLPERHHGPTLAYHLRDQLVTRSGSYGMTGYLSLIGAAQNRVDGPIGTADSGLLSTDGLVERFFGHWVCEGLPMELAAEEAGERAVVFDRTKWMHGAGYRDLTGFDPLEVGNATHFERFCYLDDRHMNDGKVARFHRLRDRIRAAVQPDDTATIRGVFLRRGTTGTRRLMVNEDALAERLAAEGFAVIDPEAMTSAEIARALARARIALLVEGSSTNHALLAMPKGATLMHIQPPWRFNAYKKGYAEALGMHYAYGVADPRGEGGNADFHMPEDRLLALIALTETMVARAAVRALV